MDREVQAQQDRVGALGHRGEVGEEHEREGRGVDDEAQGVHAGAQEGQEEGEDDGPGQERRCRRAGPPRGTARPPSSAGTAPRCGWRSPEGGGKRPRRQEPPPGEGVGQHVEGAHGIEEESEEQVRARASWPSEATLHGAQCSCQRPPGHRSRRTRALVVTRTAPWIVLPREVEGARGGGPQGRERQDVALAEADGIVALEESGLGRRSAGNPGGSPPAPPGPRREGGRARRCADRCPSRCRRSSPRCGSRRHRR